MQVALSKLRAHLPKLDAKEENERRWVEYEKVRAERDALAAELKALYPSFALRLANVLFRIEANDQLVEMINTRAAPAKAEPLLGAGAMARGLQGYVVSGSIIPRITAALVLPSFEYAAHAPYQWHR